ncbi:MAG: hypothetical protein PHY39_08105, partial [Endomicrobiaceae bacterium]|nr:hypothetical protein [Endomicrobiaceae bacterium]
ATRGTVAQMMWNMLNTQMWEVGSESESNGLTYGKGETMLTVKFPKFNTATTATGVTTYAPNYIEAQTVTAIDIIDSTTIDVTFGTAGKVRFNNVSVLDFNTYSKYDVLYTVEKVDGVNTNIGKSIYKDNAKVVYGTVTKSVAATTTAGQKVTVNGIEYEGDTDNTAIVTTIAKGDFVVLKIDANGKVDEAKKLATSGEIVIKEVKTSTDGKTVTFVKQTNADNSNIAVNLTNNKETMFVTYDANGNTKLLGINDIKAGMVIEAYTSAATNVNGIVLGGTEKVYVVSDKTLSGKVEKIVETVTDLFTLTINGVEYDIRDNSLTNSAISLFEGETVIDQITASEVKGLVGQTISAKLDAANDIVYVEADSTTLVDNYAIFNSIWTENVEGITTTKVKLVTLNGVEKVLNLKVTGTLGKVTPASGADYLENGEALAGATYTIGTDIKAQDVFTYTLTDNEITAVTKKVFTAVSAINETAQLITAGSVEGAYDSTSKFIKYSSEVINSKDVYTVSSFDAKSIKNVSTTTFVMVKDSTTNVIEYLIYNAQGASSSDKDYGIVTAVPFISATISGESVWSVTIKDIVTGATTSYEMNKGATASFAATLGQVVTIAEKADGYYTIAAFTGNVTAGLGIPNAIVGDNTRLVVANATAVQYGENYKVTNGSDILLFTGDAEIIFIENNEIVEGTYGIDDIVSTDSVYGIVDVDDTVGELYSTIVVIK